MSLTVKFGDQQRIVANKQSVSGVNLTAYINHLTLNTAFAADFLTLESATCWMKLKRNGVETFIFNDNLRNLLANSAFMRAQNIMFSGDQSLLKLTQVVQTAGLYEVVLLPMTILLPGIINLYGDDELEFVLNLNLGTAVAATVNPVGSYFLMDFMDGVGVEEGIPTIKFETLQVAQSNWNLACGDNVVDIKWLNSNLKSYLAANRVLINCNLSSDKFKRSDNDLELFTKNFTGDFIPSATFQPFQSFQLYSGVPINNVALDFTLTASNVTAGKNVVAISKINRTAASVNRANKYHNKHAIRNVRGLR